MNVAIFTTSEIHSTYKPRNNAVLKATLNGRSFYSTGLLEKAKADGYHVLVVSTRETLDTHDDWWRGLVGRIFLGTPREELKCTCPDCALEVPGSNEMHMADQLHRIYYNAAWEKLYAHFDLPWPLRDKEPVFWTEARARLENHGYKLGNTFHA